MQALTSSSGMETSPAPRPASTLTINILSSRESIYMSYNNHNSNNMTEKGEGRRRKDKGKIKENYTDWVEHVAEGGSDRVGF